MDSVTAVAPTGSDWEPLISHLSSVALCGIAVGLVLFALLLVRKGTVRYRPRYVTRVSRAGAESCMWLHVLTDFFFQSSLRCCGEAWRKSLASYVTAWLEDNGYALNVVCAVTSLSACVPQLQTINLLPNKQLPSETEFECELAYRDPDVCVNLSADLPAFRGKTLPCKLAVSNVSVFAHCRVEVTIQAVEDDVPRAVVSVSLVSEPIVQLFPRHVHWWKLEA